MAERGIDIGDQRPKGLQEFIGTAQFEYVITVCDRAEKACPMFPGKGLVSAGPLQTRQAQTAYADRAWRSHRAGHRMPRR
jgi:protein-tyrosine-phosphatase